MEKPFRNLIHGISYAVKYFMNWLYWRPIEKILTIPVLSALGMIILNWRKLFDSPDPLTRLGFFLNIFAATLIVSPVIAYIFVRFLGPKLMPTGIPSNVARSLRRRDIAKLTDGAIIHWDRNRFKITEMQFPTHLFEYADSAAKANFTGIINHTAFSNKLRLSLWAGTQQEKIKRNRSHYLKNSRVLALVQNPNKRNITTGAPPWIAFTHIIPVTKSTWDSYLKEEISDLEFSADDICPLTQNAGAKNLHEKAYGLIIFSIALYKDHESTPLENIDNRLNLLFRCLAWHLRGLIKAHFSNEDEVPIMLQTSVGHFSKLLEDCGIKPSGKSKDCCPIYCAYIKIRE
jgi:hypothetical protein